MRIVAGSAGSIPLFAPPPPARPTMDRVREALFGTLGERVIDACVLDLFAGSGSLGLEAMSRGATSAVLVENNKQCLQVLRRNLEKTKLVAQVETVDVFSYLDRLAKPASFDLIFADPPYRKKKDDRDFATELLAASSLRQTLVNDGLVLLETHFSWDLPAGSCWKNLHQRRYGEAKVWVLSPPRTA